jgi:ribosomal protein L32
MFHIVTSVRCDKCGKFAPWSLSSRTEPKKAETLQLAEERGWRTVPQGEEKEPHHLCPECVEKDPWVA